MSTVSAMPMIITVSVPVVIAMATFVSMTSISVRVIIVTVAMIRVCVILVTMIFMPVRFFFFLRRNCTARVETDVGNNRKRHRFNRLLWH